MSAEGMYRKRDGWSDQHSVRVKYDGAVELEVPEQFYKEKGWQPPFDELPWGGDSPEPAKNTEGPETQSG
jgi:hypothetical protein